MPKGWRVMENPQTWGEAEKIVRNVMLEHEQNMIRERPVIGLSIYRKITDALRAEGLLNDDSPIVGNGETNQRSRPRKDGAGLRRPG